MKAVIENRLVNIMGFPGIGKTSLAKNSVKYIAERLGHDHRYAVDSSKIKSQLDWRPRSILEDYLEEIIQSIDFLD